MNIEIDYFYTDAATQINRTCKERSGSEENVEEVIVEYVTSFLSENEITEPDFILDFRTRPYETPVYIVCKFVEEEDTLHLLVATKKDAIETNNHSLVDAFELLAERNSNN